MIKASSIEELTSKELTELNEIYTKNWLINDGENFTKFEARYLIKFLELGENSGIDGLKKALSFRLYSRLLDDEIMVEGNELIYRIKKCRVNNTVKNQERICCPCKSVGVVEYEAFAKEIDTRFETKLLNCCRDSKNTEYKCVWQFSLK